MNGGTGVKDFMDGMGLGMLVEQVYIIFVEEHRPVMTYES